MRTRIILILVLTFTVFPAKADDKTPENKITCYSDYSLPVVYGWFFDQKKDKWITKEKRIKNIDKFLDYRIKTFGNNSQKYVAIIKQTEKGNRFLIDTYIIDREEYISEMNQGLKDAIIRLPILKHHKAEINNEDELTASVLGIDALPEDNKRENSYFVLQYKFLSNSTVKFLFYTEKCVSAKCHIEGLGLSPKYAEEFLKNVGNDSLYDNFYYKTTVDYFTSFIDLPIN